MDRISSSNIGLKQAIDGARGNQVASPDVIANVVRSVILGGQLDGGAPLRQDEVALCFGVSRIPVREALRRLCAEGLVDFRTNRGFVVSVLAPAEARELLEIRSTLEVKAMQLALPKWSDETFRYLRTVLDEAEITTSVDQWSELNRSFHEILYRPAERTKLLGLIANLNAQVERYIRLLVSRSDYRLQAQLEHRAILSAAEVRNAIAVSVLIEQHANETATQLERFLSACGTPATRRN